MHITESLCCIPETNTTLKSTILHFFLKKRKKKGGPLLESHQDPTLSTPDHLPFLPSHEYSRCPFPHNRSHSTGQLQLLISPQNVSSVPLKAAVHLASSTACSINSIPRTWEVY